MYNILMNDKDVKRAVLIEFGFGEVNPKEVEKWVRVNFPMEYKALKAYKNHESNVIYLERENMTVDERSKLLDDILADE